MLTSVKELRSREELDEALRGHSCVVLHFWASWCQASAHMDSVFSQLCTDTPQARFYRIEAEEQPEISERYGVPAVPFFVFIKDGAVVDKLEGANPAELANKVANLAGPPNLVNAAAPASLGMAAGPMVLEAVKDIATENSAAQAGSVSSDDVKVRIEQLLDANPVILFMKGTPQEPRCGFSRKVVDALNAVGVKFDTFDILTDEDIRQGLKIFSNWPTYPQLYCKGELLGGCDVVLEMQKNGELQEILVEKGLLFPTKHAARSDTVPTPEPTPAVFTEAKIPATTEVGPGLSELLKSGLRNLIDSSNIMLFMKGTKEEPRCGFSKRMVEALKEEGLDFGSFDILSDDEVRQGLKIFSNWPTYPQLYIKGELIGGSDIVLEMHKSGELKQIFAEKGLLQLGNTKSHSEPLEDRLKRLIESSPTMLFMKGTPDAPRCKFSTKVVNVLKESGITFGSFDILTDEEVREGLKTYSNWPTFPQLYHTGQLIGGCDIVLDMQKTGELMSLLSG